MPTFLAGSAVLGFSRIPRVAWVAWRTFSISIVLGISRASYQPGFTVLIQVFALHSKPLSSLATQPNDTIFISSLRKFAKSIYKICSKPKIVSVLVNSLCKVSCSFVSGDFFKLTDFPPACFCNGFRAFPFLRSLEHALAGWKAPQPGPAMNETSKWPLIQLSGSSSQAAQ